MTPPGLARRWLACITPAHVRQSLLDDLDEVFRHLAATRGIAAARRWYWRQAIAGTPRLVAMGRPPGADWTRRLQRRRALNPAHVGDIMTSDVVYAVRGLTQKPLFALTAVLTLALGIGANSAMFSVVRGVLLRPLPYPSPERLMMLWTFNPRQGYDKDVSSYPNFDDWRRENTSFDGLSAYRRADFTLTEAGDPAQISGAIVTPEFFEVLGVAPSIGRAFGPREGAAGGDRVAIVTDGLWQTRFGGDPAAVGRTITLNGVAHEILGVMPPSFAYPDTAQVWTPLAPSERFADLMQARGAYWLQVVGRLKPGVERRDAQAEMDAIAAALERAYADVNSGIGVRLVPMHEEIVGDVRQPLLILFGAVGFVLLIACVNVANLLLTRSALRQKELAVRAALGAGRGRLVRQMLTESLVLATAGGAAGLLLAIWGIDVLQSLAPANLPRLRGVRIDATVLLYTSLAVLVTGVIFGSAPAMQGTAVMGEFLKDGGRAGSDGSRGRRLRSTLAIVEIAVALVLLIGAGLLVRSFVAINRVQLGFDQTDILVVRVDLPTARYPDGAHVTTFYGGLATRLRALPGVKSVGLGSSVLLLSGLSQSADLSILGRPPLDRNVRSAPVTYDSVTPAFFQTLGIPLRRGRLFTDADSATAERVVMVNESLVRRFFPDGEPLGARLTFGDPADPQTGWATIVGVVGDTRRSGVDRTPREEVYYPFDQAPDRRMYALIRTSGDPLALAPGVQAAVWSIDRNQPIHSTRTLEAILSEAQAGRRFTMQLLGLFSVIALALAAVGIYGVIAHSTAQRTREMGIRMALGARRADVLRMVLKEGLVIGGVGLALGIVVTLPLTRFMSGLLFGVSARDPITFAALALGLLLVAAFSALIPAVRAVRVNPVVALRAE